MANKTVNDVERENSIKKVLNSFNEAKVDVDTLQAAALKDPAELIESLVGALKAVDLYFKELGDVSHGKKHSLREIAIKHDFLKAMAGISPTFKIKMDDAGLLDADPKEIFRNELKLAALKKFLAQVLQAEALSTLRKDLANGLTEYYRTVEAASKEKADELRKAIGRHDVTAHEEFNEMGRRTIDSKRSGAMFDPVKVIGHLLASEHYKLYMAPLKNIIRPKARFTYKGVNLDEEPLLDLNRQKWGSVNAPDAPAPVNMPITGGKPGGPV